MQLVDPDARSSELLQDPRLEILYLGLGETIGLGDDRHEVDLGAQPLHHIQVQRL